MKEKIEEIIHGCRDNFDDSISYPFLESQVKVALSKMPPRDQEVFCNMLLKMNECSKAGKDTSEIIPIINNCIEKLQPESIKHASGILALFVGVFEMQDENT